MAEAEKKSKFRVFLSRTVSTVALWAVVIAVFFSDNAWAFTGLVFLLGGVSIREYVHMAKSGGLPTQCFIGPVCSLIYLGVVCSVLALMGQDSFDLLHRIDSLALILVAILSFTYQLRFGVEGKTPLLRVASTVLGFVYIAFLFSFMARLLFFENPAVERAVPGAFLVLWVIVVTKFTDMGAYLSGTICGNFMQTHKMIPWISPGKTWEGFIGANIIALGAGCGLYALMPEQLAVLGGWLHVVVLGVLLPLLAVVGDLAESVIKRSLNIKDSGGFLPGIGGALDLIDSLCFTAPVAYFYLIWVV